MKSKFVIIVLLFSLVLLLVSSLNLNADTIICNNKGVSTGASKAEVTNKCGEPLSISRDTVKTSGKVDLLNRSNQSGGRVSYEEETTTGETWTYVIGGCYREFVFSGNTLERIINGGLAQ